MTPWRPGKTSATTGGRSSRWVGHHFLDEDKIVKHLAKCKGFDEEQARALVLQVKGRDYNPPKRGKIRQSQEQQEFPICPNLDDPDACNVYKNLNFPPEV